MTRYLKLFAYLTATLCAGAAWAQTSDQPETTSSPVAYVYVSRPTHIDAFAASTTGKLTVVPGSPFSDSVSSMSVNGKFLFGTGDNGKDIYSFSIGSNGALKQVSETNAQKYNSLGCGSIGPLQIDDTGATLYNQVTADCEDSAFIQAFKIEDKGELQFLGNATGGVPSDIATLYPLSFLGTNKYAYQTGCSDDDGILGPVNEVYKRESNGMLTIVDFDNVSPNAKNPDDIYCPWGFATDPTDHLTYAFQDFSGYSGEFVGPIVLATYTADSNGILTTKSTYENMPATDLAAVSAMSISPSGKLLAVGGPGFQVFHFNGSSPITHYTGRLQTDYGFQQFGWDGDNHLYALGGGKLFVYTVTSTSIKEASGSPYSIPEASSVIVRSLK
jgi:hypothetical protein